MHRHGHQMMHTRAAPHREWMMTIAREGKNTHCALTAETLSRGVVAKSILSY